MAGCVWSVWVQGQSTGDLQEGVSVDFGVRGVQDVCLTVRRALKIFRGLQRRSREERCIEWQSACRYLNLASSERKKTKNPRNNYCILCGSTIQQRECVEEQGIRYVPHIDGFIHTTWPKVCGHLLVKHLIPKSWALIWSWPHLCCHNSLHTSG